jgi:hypothetical protein
MSKQSILSQKYVRRMKWTYVVLTVTSGLLALFCLFIPSFVRQSSESYQLAVGGMVLMTTLCVLFGMKCSSLLEHDAIYRAITKQTGDNTGEPK